MVVLKEQEKILFFYFIEGQTPMLLNNIGLEKEAKGVWECKNILFLSLMAH